DLVVLLEQICIDVLQTKRSRPSRSRETSNPVRADHRQPAVSERTKIDSLIFRLPVHQLSKLMSQSHALLVASLRRLLGVPVEHLYHLPQSPLLLLGKKKALARL